MMVHELAWLQDYWVEVYDKLALLQGNLTGQAATELGSLVALIDSWRASRSVTAIQGALNDMFTAQILGNTSTPHIHDVYNFNGCVSQIMSLPNNFTSTTTVDPVTGLSLTTSLILPIIESYSTSTVETSALEAIAEASHVGSQSRVFDSIWRPHSAASLPEIDSVAARNSILIEHDWRLVIHLCPSISVEIPDETP